MSLNESIVEDAALEWFFLRSAPLNYGGQVGELGGRRVKIEIGRVKSQSPFPISLFTLHSSSIRRLNPANACGNPHPASPTGRGEEARATVKRYFQVRFERRLNP
jgi:hypothetical protein